ncbi:MAG: HTTM domain-containing protein [Fodinibius sp.]|nr:HTTM domain-containing protein [Fodinibius sp.]
MAPLAVFRALFGFIMLVSTIRFAAMGWIYELYIRPDFFFTYYGFDWVAPLGEMRHVCRFFRDGTGRPADNAGLAITGWELSSFSCTFSYVELLDKTNYLNHYYFVSIISFLLMLVPAHRSFSLDVLRRPELKVDKVPAWMINIFKLQLGIVYFYAGAAKLNPDWLLNAMPMKIWLPAKTHLPIIGWLFEYNITAYLFSWAGAFYDLTIAFFLLYRPTRIFAYISVIVFHMMTYFLFQIGMFPFIMILSTLIFFSAEFHEALIQKVQTVWRWLVGSFSQKNKSPISSHKSDETNSLQLSTKASGIFTAILGVHFLLQLLVPLRFALYPGNLFWTEQGYRFSWRVMLMEKAGYAAFNVHNPQTGRSWEVANWEHLTENQEKMMATQPDMILQYAHYLEDHYQEQGIADVEITVQSRVTLNGRRSRPMIDPNVDLTTKERGFAHKNWILPYPETSKSWFDTNTP